MSTDFFESPFVLSRSLLVISTQISPMAVLFKLQKASLLEKSLKRNKKLFTKYFTSANLLGQFK